MKRLYPVFIEKPNTKNEAWGLIVPDLEGCFSAADSEEEILDKAREAILFHLEALDIIPNPTPFLSMKKKHPKKNILLVDVDTSVLTGPAKRINVTIREGLLLRIDRAASQKGISRSEFLADAAIRAIG